PRTRLMNACRRMHCLDNQRQKPQFLRADLRSASQLHSLCFLMSHCALDPSVEVGRGDEVHQLQMACDYENDDCRHAEKLGASCGKVMRDVRCLTNPTPQL